MQQPLDLAFRCSHNMSISGPTVHKGELTRLWSGSAHRSRPDSGGRRWLLAGHQRAGFGDSSRLLQLAWCHLCRLQCRKSVSQHAADPCFICLCVLLDMREHSLAKIVLQVLGPEDCI